MAEQEYALLKIRKEVHKTLKLLAEHKRYDIQDYASDLLLMSIARYEFLKRIAPNFTYTFVDNQMLITDSKKKKLFTVWSKDSRLYCEDDNSFDCEHIHFALATPELATLWMGSTPKEKTAKA